MWTVGEHDLRIGSEHPIDNGNDFFRDWSDHKVCWDTQSWRRSPNPYHCSAAATVMLTFVSHPFTTPS